MRSRRRLCAAALVATLLLPAASTVRADETSPANVAAARRHFEKARADYGQGAYKEAIAELEAAHALDPNAKDLVFNLGVVHEKLADIDEALKWFRLYTSMNLTPQERDRADAYVKRLEGARKELDAKQAAAAASASSAPGASAAPTEESPPKTNDSPRLTYTIIGASVAAVGLGVGIVMGVKAEADKPPNTFVTGRTGSYDDLVNRTNTAHNEAVVADIGFGVAVAAAAVTTYLFFTRGHNHATPSTGSPSSPSVSVAPTTGGGAFFVQGSF